jgi:hypothetical protein
MILDAARSLSPPRATTLRCSPAVAPKFVYLGATDLPGVRLVTVDDR